MSRVRLVPIVFIVIISLAILFGVWRLYQHFDLVSPLKNNLSSIKVVQTVDVSAGSPTVVKVRLNDKVSDLQSTYVQIASRVGEVISGSGQIVLLDNRNDALNVVYENLQPYLAQAAAKGDYLEMLADATKAAKSSGVDSRITMDDHNFYIQLKKGDNYLYQIRPFTQRQGGASS